MEKWMEGRMYNKWMNGEVDGWVGRYKNGWMETWTTVRMEEVGKGDGYMAGWINKNNCISITLAMS